MASQSNHCALCGRDTPLTRHHLIPRTLHARKRIRRRYTREELNKLILWVCRPCHSKIHNTLSEMELAEQYYSRDSLLGHEDICRFVQWISDKPQGFKPKKAAKRK